MWIEEEDEIERGGLIDLARQGLRGQVIIQTRPQGPEAIQMHEREQRQSY